MQYEIRIGEVYDLESKTVKAHQTIIITEEQRQIIEYFAHQRKDAIANTIYKLNDCEFRICPHFGTQAK